MRLRAIAFVVLALGGAAAGALWLGDRAAREVEDRTRTQATTALAAAGEVWATAETDGLILRLDGAAPDEASRVRAVEIVRGVVDPRRVEDRTTLAAAPTPPPAPAFALELLRTGDEVTAIGLAPAGAAPDAGDLPGRPVDMVERVDAPAPAGWQAALDLGLAALAALPGARVAVAPGRVEVTGLVEDDAARAAVEARLTAARPEGVALTLDVEAPRPAIAPYRFELALRDGLPELAACAAPSGADAAAILAAARTPGGDCAIGPGAPSPEWPQAAAAGAAALRALAGGRFTLEDETATLAAPQGADPGHVAAARADLAAALPEGFTLAPDPTPPSAPTEAPAPPPPVAARFVAELDEGGGLRIAGPAGDAASRAAVATVAAALFGPDRVEDATAPAQNLPEGWTARLLAGVEALAVLKTGRLEMTPDAAEIAGEAPGPDGAGRVRSILSEGAPGALKVAVRFDAAAAAAEARARAVAADPAGTCAADVAAALAATPVVFAAGSAELEPEGEAAVAALAATLAACPPLDFEVGGHTDGAGDPARNLALSEARAEAVKAALDAADLPQMRFTAKGYGSDRPVAPNDTPEGRTANRRIELTLLTPRLEPAEPPPAPPVPYEEPAFGPR
ncbi:OmpA family protein [Amaricoccus sp.]|uniref:OmpA family protein n=1 Tax=Amaricoccus sp. TaxID=1872485 RepID=UPI001B4E74DA|nr:OmpA family protein [Amaricoccus sp.]MBP7000782.1 OmpA family protein [Amaricoccus sp.]